MNQTWENGQKSSFGPILAHFDPNLVPKNISCGFYLYQMLRIVPSYHCAQFQEKLIHKTWENGKKPSLGTDFGPFGPNLGPQNFFVDFMSTTC